MLAPGAESWRRAISSRTSRCWSTRRAPRFDQLDYENTVKALDSAIGAIEARPTPEAKRLLPSAYEMRARSLFGLDKMPEARADFVSLLKIDPGYQLTGQVSPRIMALFDEVAKLTVTELRFAVVPPDAEVLLDGVRVPSTATMPIAVGDHTITASRIGYKPRCRSRSARSRARPPPWIRWRSSASPRSSGS